MPRKLKSINVEIGARVKEQRTAQRLTRDNLAQLTGYSANFIQEVECGRSGLSSESIKAFATALHVSADFLLFGHESMGFERVFAQLKTVPPEKLEHVIKIIDEAVKCAQ